MASAKEGRGNVGKGVYPHQNMGSGSGTYPYGPYSGKGKGKDGGRGKCKGGQNSQPAMLALGDKPSGCLGLMCRGLSFAVSEEDLIAAFSYCGGGPTRVRLLVDAAGDSKGKAFLDFASEAAVGEAMKLYGTKLKGRKLILEYLRPNDSG